MLKTISPLISPALLKILAEMGHGDDIVFADAHFPGNRLGQRVIRADGHTISMLLKAIDPLLALNDDTHALTMMAADGKDLLDPEVELRYINALVKEGMGRKVDHIARQDFYERASQAYAVVMTGETAPYGNIILRKGVTPGL